MWSLLMKVLRLKAQTNSRKEKSPYQLTKAPLNTLQQPWFFSLIHPSLHSLSCLSLHRRPGWPSGSFTPFGFRFVFQHVAHHWFFQMPRDNEAKSTASGQSVSVCLTSVTCSDTARFPPQEPKRRKEKPDVSFRRHCRTLITFLCLFFWHTCLCSRVPRPRHRSFLGPDAGSRQRNILSL